MAEEDAEIALLHQMQAGQESWDDDGANGAAEGELPSNTEHMNQQEVKRENDQVPRALSPSGAGAVSGGGDYDPSPVASLPAITIAGQEDSRSSSRASSRKQKTVGGFIADDSDEEYDSSTSVQAANVATGLQAAANPNRAISPSPLQTSISQQDLTNVAENQDDSKVAPSSYNVPVNSSTSGVPLTSAGPSAQGVSVPKARLPNDRTGMLEDRIKDDPRGDLDAWLSLITEHRKRNKLDDARAVYDRFLKVFPHAVRLLLCYYCISIDMK
jgi:cleavage stimulation factor subunit 3